MYESSSLWARVHGHEHGERRERMEARNRAHDEETTRYFNSPEGQQAQSRAEREGRNKMEAKKEWVAARQAERREWRVSSLTPLDPRLFEQSENLLIRGMGSLNVPKNTRK